MSSPDWKNCHIQAFWGEIAPCEHLVQVHENDKVFLDTLEGYVGTGLLAGESVIIIGTQHHIDHLDARLRRQNIDLDAMLEKDHYIPLEVNKTLERFMVDNWPNEAFFVEAITEIINRAKGSDGKRKIRAFGEMVAVLWEKGMNGATVQLENLWNQLHECEDFTLYCAYPKSGLTQSPHHALDAIWQAHSKIIDGSLRPATEIYYRDL